MSNTSKTSQLNKFYQLSVQERRRIIQAWLETSDVLPLDQGLTVEQSDQMVENVIGTFALPFAVASNFLINGKDYLIPLVIEEPSVVAALSSAAKSFRKGGGFETSSDKPLMIGQIQVLDVPNVQEAVLRIEAHKASLLAAANDAPGSLMSRGGGAKDIEVRILEDDRVGVMLVIHLLYDTQDAMGANVVNTAVEHLGEEIESLTGGRVHLRILSNLSDHRKARAEGMIPASDLTRDEMSGEEVARAIVEAGIFAEIDPYRATTHNKGIMNGIDPVVIATGNDWRAVEAGAHAFAARSGRYSSLTQWWQDADGNLRGRIELPLAVGIVGGATRVHPTAQFALRLLGVTSAQELAEVMAAVGLAQNLGAIRALSTDGIQRGHMRLHARQLAMAAGAPPHLAAEVAAKMIAEGNIRLERAKTFVRELQERL
jgi:hydroxymethylglutaryl-CoA reductase